MLKRIIQAPMAGIASAEFVAKVCNAGAIGSYGAGYTPKEILRKKIRIIKANTKEPYNINLFIPNYQKPVNDKEMRNFILKLWAELGEVPPKEEKFIVPSFEEQVEVLLEEKVPIFSFTFGIPSQQVIQAFKQQNTYIIGTATSVIEAERLKEVGVDAIVCQGVEAGGHRGTFLEDSRMEVNELLQRISENVKNVPLIAAGGIMNKEDVQMALGVGASAVQMGTAFITTFESDAPSVFKNALLSKNTRISITNVYTGRFANAIVNRLMIALEESGLDIPPFPQQHALTLSLRHRASQLGRADFMGNLAGRNAARCQSCSLQDLIASLS